jgi:hypothetical protein
VARRSRASTAENQCNGLAALHAKWSMRAWGRATIAAASPPPPNQALEVASTTVIDRGLNASQFLVGLQARFIAF